MHIRLAVMSDIDALNRIALNAKAHWGYSADQLRAWAPDLLTPPETIASMPTFVAELGATAIGFAQLDTSAQPWELVSLWVQPERMGKGVGRQLLNEVAKCARLAGRAEIAIDSDPNAELFYIACGASLVARIPAPIEGDMLRTRPQLLLLTGSA